MNRFYEGLNFWKLAIFKCACKALTTLFATLVAVLNGTSWGDYTGTQKLVAVASIAAAVVGVIEAFLNDTMSKLVEKKKDETGTFLKSDVKNP